MFDLDRAIAKWRQQLIAAGMATSEELDELESHVREEIQRQLQSGKTSQEGFGTAVQNLGTARAGVALLMSDRERKRWGMVKAPMQESSKER